MNQKIIELFKYRKLPILLNQGPYSFDTPLVKKLIQLQTDIYELDLHLESNWKISKRSLAKYWTAMYQSLKELGVPRSEWKDYLKHIEKYQTHELAMRSGKYPSSMSLSYYYYYKSCDVKLLRRIIYDYIPDLKKNYRLSDWREFDMITEINDDISDVYEDLEVINGNYFQFSLIHLGKTKTERTISSYLKLMKKKANLRAKKNPTVSQQKLNKWTQDYADKTLRLLKKTVKEIDLKELQKQTELV